MEPKIEILDLNKVNAIFDELLLTKQEGNAVKRATLNDTMKPIVGMARQNLESSGNSKTGSLKRSLGTVAKVRDNMVYAAVGSRKVKQLHFINSGTVDRTSRGTNRGKIAGTEFFDKAVLSHIGSIPDLLQASFDRRMQIFMEKKY